MQDNNLMNELARQKSAEIEVELIAALQYKGKPFIRKRIYLDEKANGVALNAAEEFPVPFKKVYVMDASDDNATVILQLNKKSPLEDSLSLRKTGKFEDTQIYSAAWLSYTYQAGSWIDLGFFLNGSYNSGFASTYVTGTVGRKTFDSCTAAARQTLGVDTADLVAAAATTERVVEVYNDSGADIAYGSTSSITISAGANKGLILADGETLRWDVKSALYMRSLAGGNINKQTKV